MIVQTPNPVLFKKALPVETIDKKILKIVSGMKKTLIDSQNPKGVGLAAPQIGESLRIFIMQPRAKGPISIHINPVILMASSQKDIIRRYNADPKKIKDDKRLEGCLSINNVWGKVKRSIKVRLRYQDLSGKIHEKDYAKFEATIIQHEVDHLDGILFTKRVLEQGNKLYRIEEDKEGKEKLIEIEI